MRNHNLEDSDSSYANVVTNNAEQEVTQRVKQPNFNTKKCDVFMVANGKINFYFNNYGIQLPYSGDLTDQVEVKYRGKIGMPDFKVWL